MCLKLEFPGLGLVKRLKATLSAKDSPDPLCALPTADVTTSYEASSYVTPPGT